MLFWFGNTDQSCAHLRQFCICGLLFPRALTPARMASSRAPPAVRRLPLRHGRGGWVRSGGFPSRYVNRDALRMGGCGSQRNSWVRGSGGVFHPHHPVWLSPSVLLVLHVPRRLASGGAGGGALGHPLLRGVPPVSPAQWGVICGTQGRAATTPTAPPAPMRRRRPPGVLLNPVPAAADHAVPM